jgi:hypothetical protein
MIAQTAEAVRTRVRELETYWQPRKDKAKKWYRLIQMVDELRTDKMESFVGNDPKSTYNLVLHMLDSKIPHRISEEDLNEPEMAGVNESVGKFLAKVWEENRQRIRRSSPIQSLSRNILGFLLSTGWIASMAMLYDSGEKVLIQPLNPVEVFPMWDFSMGLVEVGRHYRLDAKSVRDMGNNYGWDTGWIGKAIKTDVYDYWWVDNDVFGDPMVWNAIVIGNSPNGLMKFSPTLFRRIPIYTAPAGGLPDMGTLSEGTELSVSSYNAGAQVTGDRWKEEIGQSVIATNENIYKAWNKIWTFSLQLLRDTAQPRIFERSRTGKKIVTPENIFRRGAVFRGGPEDSVDYMATPPIPLELRSTQLDMEAMMQRGGPSWALHGAVSGQLTSYVMSQIAASANQILRPYHDAYIDMIEDIDNDIIQAIRDRGAKPYGWSVPREFKEDMRVTARYEVEVPGDLVHRATVARMLDPDFRLSYSYVMSKLFPDVRNPMMERARVRTDQVERNPENALIAAVVYYRKQAAYLSKIGDNESSKLYELAADATEAQLKGAAQTAQQNEPMRRTVGNREEAMPRMEQPQLPSV